MTLKILRTSRRFGAGGIALSKTQRFLLGGSLKELLVKLVVACGIAATAAFFALSYVGQVVSEDTGLISTYVSGRYAQSLTSLKTYIAQHNITPDNAFELGDWADKNSAVEIEVFDPEQSLFASDFSLDATNLPDFSTDDLPEYDRMRAYFLELSDGTPVTVYLFGSFDLIFVVIVNVIALVGAIVVFFLLLLWGVTRRIDYIRRLEQAVLAMSSGDLETPVEVNGQDELASLASQIDQMRVSFSDQIEAEKSAKQANRDLVTTMSHDLRTPLTSLLLYVEILKDGKYADKVQLQSYIQKIHGRCMQIKKLSDALFHHFLVEDVAAKPEETGPLGEVAGVALEEFSSSLEAAGFEVMLEGTLEGVDVPVPESAFSRVLDNLLSNIYKYARKNSCIRVLAYQESATEMLPARVGLSFSNEIGTQQSAESTHIGLENIRALMEEMGGTYSATVSDATPTRPSTFTSTLEFALHQAAPAASCSTDNTHTRVTRA